MIRTKLLKLAAASAVAIVMALPGAIQISATTFKVDVLDRDGKWEPVRTTHAIASLLTKQAMRRGSMYLFLKPSPETVIVFRAQSIPLPQAKGEDRRLKVLTRQNAKKRFSIPSGMVEFRKAKQVDNFRTI